MPDRIRQAAARSRAQGQTGAQAERLPIRGAVVLPERGRLTARAVLQLQAAAGNAAVATLLPVQRGLNPLDAADRPGRLPDGEKTLKDLLAANGFALTDRRKARSAAPHDADLQARMQRVLAAESAFTKSNVSPAKRRKLRTKLAYEYDSLIDAAGRYRDDAETAYDQALTTEATRIRALNPAVNELFKGGAPWKAAEPTIALPARFATLTNRDAFAEEVRGRYRKLYKTPAAPVSALSTDEQQQLQAEKAGVSAELEKWKTTRYDAEGCNPNGTWGTSKGGAGAGFLASHLTPTVWAELMTWWQGKQGTYVTPSDTTTWSLKKYRNLSADSPLSATFNYHVFVP